MSTCCLNCNKIYKDRGLKIHLNKCNKVYDEIKKKEYEKKLKEDSKIKIIFDHNKTLTKWNYLPDDCIKNIYSYLLLHDHHSSYYSLYNDIKSVSLVCKSFYINRPNTDYMINNIKDELNTTICRSQSMKIYDLTSDEMDELYYDIIKKRYGYIVHVFNLIDVIKLAYDKYGTYYDYRQYKNKSYAIKLLNKKEKNIIYDERKKLYNDIFPNKDEYIDEYEKYYKYYVKNGVPKLDFIKNMINNETMKIERKNILINTLNKQNIHITDEVDRYIKYGKYFNEAVQSIKLRDMYEEEYFSFLANNNIEKGIYDKIAYKYINLGNKYMLIDFLNLIKLITKFNKNTSSNYILNNYDEYTSKNAFYTDVVKWHRFNNENIDHYPKDLQNMIEMDREKCKNFNYCKCDNVGSLKCIDKLCSLCCNNINCTRHKKKLPK